MGRLLFYPALWLAYQDWRTERNGERDGNVELEAGVEEETRLLGRESVDGLRDVVEYDESKERT
jgi:hypothetical protein